MTKTQRWLLVVAAFMAALALFVYSVSATIVKLNSHFASMGMIERYF
jgi:hypothetical protein